MYSTDLKKGFCRFEQHCVFPGGDGGCHFEMILKFPAFSPIFGPEKELWIPFSWTN